MAKLYPKHKHNLAGFKKVFKELSTIELFDHQKKLLIELYACYDQHEDEYYTAVHGVTPKKLGNNYAIEFQPWREWLGMEIFPSTLNNYSEIDIICHCLWEMTFCGFSQDDIEKAVDNILNKR